MESNDGSKVLKVRRNKTKIEKPVACYYCRARVSPEWRSSLVEIDGVLKKVAALCEVNVCTNTNPSTLSILRLELKNGHNNRRPQSILSGSDSYYDSMIDVSIE
ncbi:hypothetical protein DICPUDRAFT_84313 [Dictyostelium purpureum]|uniref:Uncharacterized protein n=1 Tax=Dictyostelium purpureum TaxID=5786 RepID=F1A290_DICPU|nr:uncharacterized protein DICPUDRAFT_84313 [Dictyostelium purpureum]EGC29683.1 hypothetical protein DICPUDRAFT_84313 [Dictyostelium purpureum]|eukprot:XP_003293788.1 hypothetical protein DICPUDRAFT_84313 [Dictyostelium purpureum]